MYAQAQTAAEIDEVKAMTTKIACTDDDNNYITKDIRVICILVCMMVTVDMMVFTGAYGHKTTLETKRTNPAFRDAFRVYSMDIVTHRADEFWASWKDFRARNPVEVRPSAAAAQGPQHIRALHAESDDEVNMLEAAAQTNKDD